MCRTAPLPCSTVLDGAMRGWNPRTANALQAAGLLMLFALASRDVNRTMQQQPVPRAQTNAWAEHLASRSR